MANRLSQEKAAWIARKYCTNGYKKVEALLSAGYSNTYANNIGLKLFDNSRVKEEIDRIEALNRARSGYTIDQYILELDEARARAIDYKQVSAEITAIIAKGRSQGFDKDNDIGSIDQQQELDEQQQAMARRIAKVSLSAG